MTEGCSRLVKKSKTTELGGDFHLVLKSGARILAYRGILKLSPVVAEFLAAHPDAKDMPVPLETSDSAMDKALDAFRPSFDKKFDDVTFDLMSKDFLDYVACLDYMGIPNIEKFIKTVKFTNNFKVDDKQIYYDCISLCARFTGLTSLGGLETHIRHMLGGATYCDHSKKLMKEMMSDEMYSENANAVILHVVRGML